MHKAIEAGAKIDADFFKGQQGDLTVKERLLRRLTSACVTSLLGLFMLVGGVFYGLGMGWDGIKSEVDRQRRTGRVALVAALVIGLLMGIFAMFIVWLYPVSTPEVGSELISKIQSAIEPYKQYLLLLIAGCAIFLGLIFGREERRVFYVTIKNSCTKRKFSYLCDVMVFLYEKAN